MQTIINTMFVNKKIIRIYLKFPFSSWKTRPMHFKRWQKPVKPLDLLKCPIVGKWNLWFSGVFRPQRLINPYLTEEKINPHWLLGQVLEYSPAPLSKIEEQKNKCFLIPFSSISHHQLLLKLKQKKSRK